MRMRSRLSPGSAGRVDFNSVTRVLAQQSGNANDLWAGSECGVGVGVWWVATECPVGHDGNEGVVLPVEADVFSVYFAVVVCAHKNKVG